MILPNLPLNHPESSELNSSKIAYKSDPDFCAHYDEIILQTLCEYQQHQHIEIMEILTQVPPEFHKLLFPLWDTNEIVFNSITDSNKI